MLSNISSLAHLNERKTKKAGTGTWYGTCGDRLPLISFQKSAILGLHIATCINDEHNHNYNTEWDPNFPEKDGMTKGKWYKIDIGQELKTDGNYYWYVEIDGFRYHEARNDKARILHRIFIPIK